MASEVIVSVLLLTVVLGLSVLLYVWDMGVVGSTATKDTFENTIFSVARTWEENGQLCFLILNHSPNPLPAAHVEVLLDAKGSYYILKNPTQNGCKDLQGKGSCVVCFLATVPSGRYDYSLYVGKLGYSGILRKKESTWRYMREILVENNKPFPLTGYTIHFVLDTNALISEGKLKPDCSDVRFFDGKEYLPYWVEKNTCNSNSTVFWVKLSLPAERNYVLYMLYGNLAAESESNAFETFLAFDEFEDDNDPFWSYDLIQGTAACLSISNGAITLGDPSGTTLCNVTVGARERGWLVDENGYGYAIGARILGYSGTVRINIGFVYDRYTYDDGGPSWWGLYINGTQVVSWGYDVSTELLNKDVVFGVDGNYSVLFDPAYGAQAWNIQENNLWRPVFNVWNYSYAKLDFIYLRRFVYPEPSVIIGPEQPSPW